MVMGMLKVESRAVTRPRDNAKTEGIAAKPVMTIIDDGCIVRVAVVNVLHTCSKYVL